MEKTAERSEADHQFFPKMEKTAERSEADHQFFSGNGKNSGT